MSYFDVGVGKRPIEQAIAKQTPSSTHGEEMPYFAARLGSCPSKPDSRWRQSEEQADPGALVPLSSCHLVTVCPLCRGQLEAQAGIYHCAGRCGARWLEEAPGRLVDLAALPHGICGCCAPPRPLAAGAPGLICPGSGRTHLQLPGGASVLTDALPHGICGCCAPPMPLIAQGDALVCLVRPDQRYRREGQQLIALAPVPAGAAATMAAIDAALRRNSARLTTNGLFDLD
jgi:hypothetical protein